MIKITPNHKYTFFLLRTFNLGQTSYPHLAFQKQQKTIKTLDCDQNGRICDRFLSWCDFKFYVVAFLPVAESGNTVKSAKCAKSGNTPLNCVPKLSGL